MLKIAVCDDDVFMVQEICQKIETFLCRKNMAASFSRFFSSNSLIENMIGTKTYYDAVFLDIGMDGTNGLETAKLLRKNGIDTFIVFITALKDYVFDAFDVDAVNYLLKPIDTVKLHKTLDKIAFASQSLSENFLIVCKNREISKIRLSSIIYCEVFNHMVFVYEKDKQYEYQSKIDKLEKDLPQEFFRCHRSYIVNLNHVVGCKDGYATMSGGEKIPIATRRQNEFMKALLISARKEVRL